MQYQWQSDRNGRLRKKLAGTLLPLVVAIGGLTAVSGLTGCAEHNGFFGQTPAVTAISAGIAKSALSGVGNKILRTLYGILTLATLSLFRAEAQVIPANSQSASSRGPINLSATYNEVYRNTTIPKHFWQESGTVGLTYTLTQTRAAPCL